jgi:sulfate/thiosulfate-binding protein
MRLATLAVLLGAVIAPTVRAQATLLNVSYDPTRELYAAINPAFAKAWKAKTGQDVTVRASHGGSGAQARAVIEGLEADVVTLALQSDIDAIVDNAGLLPANWRDRLPDQSVPYTSTILFVVRKGNPKGIHDWADLIKPGVSVITPNPKTSGGARWNYLAAWGWALQANGGDQAKARAYVTALYQHVPILDTGARGSTITFAQRNQGDVLIAWEDDANLAVEKLGKDKMEIVVPSLTIVAEPVVAVVDKIAAKHGTTALAEAYLRYLWSPEAQEIEARNHYRPQDQAILAKHAAEFPAVKTFTIAQVFGNWRDVQKQHFADGGVFDQIYKPQ